LDAPENLLLKKHQLLKYKRLAEIGVDSVRIEKLQKENMQLNLRRLTVMKNLLMMKSLINK